MKIKTTLAIAAIAVLLTACGKGETSRASAAPAAIQAPVPQVNTADERRRMLDMLTSADMLSDTIIGKSGKACNKTCDEQPTLAACKAAVVADGCSAARDAWREKNPNLRGYEKPELK